MGFLRRVFNKDQEDEDEAFECSICKKPAVLTKKVKGVKPWEPPAAFLVNQVNFNNTDTDTTEDPVLLYFCSECLENISGYIVLMITEQERERREKLVNEKLSGLKVGTVLTMIDDNPEPLPNAQIRHMLHNTPFGNIFDMGKDDQ